MSQWQVPPDQIEALPVYSCSTKPEAPVSDPCALSRVEEGMRNENVQDVKTVKRGYKLSMAEDVFPAS